MTQAAPTLTASEVELIVQALDVVVGAAIAADRTLGYRVRPERGMVSAGTSAMEYLDKLDSWTPARRAADDLLDNPVSEALRQAITKFGARLHEIGGMKLMQEVLDRVAERDRANMGRRIGIMDHRWSGIGEWMA